MTAPRDSDPLTGIWQQHRPSVLHDGQTLWERVAAQCPLVTIHGRDLRNDTEGVGFQFQLAIRGDFYGGDIAAAYYVVQLQLFRGTISLSWLVDAMPVLEIAEGDYDLYPRRSQTLALRRRPQLSQLLTDNLASDALRFFEAVQGSRPLPEPAMPAGSSRVAPVLQGLQ